MKREIKFRGIREDGKGWVFGDLVRIPKDHGDYNTPPSSELKCFITDSQILTHEWVEVIEKTVEEYTGLKDKNGKYIYEGDILDFEIKGLGKGKSICYHAFGCFWLKVENQSEPLPLYQYEFRSDIIIEVIGNIYENQELINS